MNRRDLNPDELQALYDEQADAAQDALDLETQLADEHEEFT